MIRVLWGLAIVLATWVPLPLAAQDLPATSPGISAAPQSQPYRSAFEEFKPFAETRDTNWRAANERVLATGGHGGALAEEDADTSDKKLANPHTGHHQ
jgi:hypothetical protein